MSAFVVNKSHIAAMIDAAQSLRTHNHGDFYWYWKSDDTKQHNQLTPYNENEIGQMLLDECVASVSYRYDDSTLSDLPGPNNSEYMMPYEHQFHHRRPKPIEAIKLIHCYMYQSCEHPQWEDSEAKAFCDSLIHSLVSILPGYDDAPWEWTDKPEYNVVRLV